MVSPEGKFFFSSLPRIFATSSRESPEKSGMFVNISARSAIVPLPDNPVGFLQNCRRYNQTHRTHGSVIDYEIEFVDSFDCQGSGLLSTQYFVDQKGGLPSHVVITRAVGSKRAERGPAIIIEHG